MKLNLLVALLLFSGAQFSFAQDIPADSESPFVLFKTEDDFFNKKRIYAGEWIQREGDIVIYKKPGQKKKTRFNLKDSSEFYFGYQGAGNRWVRVYPKSYSLYGGGTKKAFCVLGANSAVFGDDGYAKEVYCTEYCTITYVDNEKKFYTDQLEEFLKAKPKLLEKYLAEKNASDKKAWKREALSTGMKYLRLFIAEN